MAGEPGTKQDLRDPEARLDATTRRFAGVEKRLEIVERRVLEIEKRLNLPPAA
ncbi:MAG: hypothetical protein ABSH05_21230 [Bryobacteraceae bacterium]|jgi:hypothetical protein